MLLKSFYTAIWNAGSEDHMTVPQCHLPQGSSRRQWQTVARSDGVAGGLTQDAVRTDLGRFSMCVVIDGLAGAPQSFFTISDSALRSMAGSACKL